MGDMKLFKVITILSSLFILTSCAGVGGNYIKETEGTFLNFPEPVTLGENQLWSAPGMLWSHIQYLRFSLNDEEKKMHQSAVYHALNNAANGEITGWHSRDRLAQGKVRVIHSFPISGGRCRVYQSFIELNGTSRHWTNNACKGLQFRDGSSKYEWKFLH
jgi:surface antigen